MFRKLMIAIALSLIAIPSVFSSSYSMIIPDGMGEDIILMDDSGNEFALDDEYVFFKTWNGFLIEQYSAEGAFTITDYDGSATLIFTRPCESYAMEMLLRRLGRNLSTVVFLSAIADADALVRYAGNADIVALGKIPVHESLVLERSGMSVTEIRWGDVVEMNGGRPEVKGPSHVVVRCPNCGETFTLYL